MMAQSIGPLAALEGLPTPGEVGDEKPRAPREVANAVILTRVFEDVARMLGVSSTELGELGQEVVELLKSNAGEELSGALEGEETSLWLGRARALSILAKRVVPRVMGMISSFGESTDAELVPPAPGAGVVPHVVEVPNIEEKAGS